MKNITNEIDLSKEYMRIAREAGIVPSNLTGAQIQAIILAGRELGLQPFQALRLMSFINGRLVMSVQLQLALARQRVGVQIVELTETGESCSVTLKRGEERVTCTYTIKDAERSGLIRNPNWQKYPTQMLRWRAIGDALRIIAPDVVMGLLSPEEAETITIEPVEVEPAEIEQHKPYPLNGSLLLKELKTQNPEEYRHLIETVQSAIKSSFPSKEAYQDYLLTKYGIRSISELTVEQAHELCKELNTNR